MEKIIIPVPKSVRYISDWSGFSLPENPSILNKQITGCGFTEWCIRNNLNLVLCSPRKILLENKTEQHPDEVYYAKNELDQALDIDSDLNKLGSKPAPKKTELSKDDKDKIVAATEQLKINIFNYYFKCCHDSKPCKILVTYDSFRHVKDALGDNIKNFYIIVDEFQSIFTDSRFKSNTELEFLDQLKSFRKLCFVSATPMIDDYLEMLDEFKDLPYYELDWKKENPSRIVKPQLIVRSCNKILDVANRIIQSYLLCNFEKYKYIGDDGYFREIESKELVIYVNSVKNICDIITKNGLTFDNTNVLCSNTPENQKKIRKAFGLKRKEEGGIGKVPGKGEPHKMFTLCTRTVYLGADFYSLCARSVILSDANIDCLSVDITLDLPQILGRQRLDCNPWKNRAELYYKNITEDNLVDTIDFKKYIKTKKETTEDLLLSYQSSPTAKSKHTLAKTFQYVAKTKHYRDDYIAVNVHGGKDLIPVINKLVMISELRAFEIQQIDYKDRFSVFKTIDEELFENDYTSDIEYFLNEFDQLKYFTDKMKYLITNTFPSHIEELVFSQVPMIFQNYIITLGKERIKALQCKKCMLEEEYNKLKNVQEYELSLLDRIHKSFVCGEKYLNMEIKEELRKIYTDLSLSISPKASDLEKYFEVKSTQIINKETGKRDHGYLILKKKD